MLAHHHDTPKPPKRAIVLGGGGVVGGAVVGVLQEHGTEVVAPNSAELDLAGDGAGDALAKLLRPDDALIILAALTPDKGRDVATFMKNLRMMAAVCGALEQNPCAHIVYMSSDAVYPMTPGLTNEDSPAAPPDLYGTMHLAREIMCADAAKETPLATLRCTLVTAATDSHNSYGPNRFRRLAADGGVITLGGEGEETRDHIMVWDVAEIVRQVVAHRSAGLVNVATGTSASFREVADLVAANFDPPAEVKFSERTGAITHRHFDTTQLRQAFPELRPTPLAEGLARVHRESMGQA